MDNAITLTLRFNLDPPNTAAMLDAVTSSLKSVGVTAVDVSQSTNQLAGSNTKLVTASNQSGKAIDSFHGKTLLLHSGIMILAGDMAMMPGASSGVSQAFSGMSMVMGNVSTAMIMLDETSNRTGTSMTSNLLNVLKSPSGIIISISILATVLTALIPLFGKTSDAAEDAAKKGLKDFADWAAQFGAGQLDQMKKYSDAMAVELQKQKDAVSPTGYVRQQIGENQFVSTPQYSDADKAEIATLDEQIKKYQTESAAIEDIIFAKQASEKVTAQENELLTATGNETLLLQAHLKDLNAQKTAGIIYDTNGQKIADEIESTEEKIATLNQTTAEAKKKILDALEVQADYADKIYAADQTQTNATALISILQKELAITDEKSKQYDLQSKINQIEEDQAAIQHRTRSDYGSESKSNIPTDDGITAPVKVSDTGSINEENRKIKDLEDQLNSALNASDRARYQAQLDLEKKHLANMETSADEQKKLDAEVAKQKIQATMDALNFIGQGFAQNTVLGKATAIAQATINTYQAATEALTVGPILGPILAALVVASGLGMVAKIAGIGIPSAPTYATGGVVVGEGGVDRVPAMLTSGEFVVRKEAALSNYNLLAAINRGLEMPRYAGGGYIGNVQLGSGTPSQLLDMKKEFAGLKKAIQKMKNEVYIQSNFDVQNYTKANKKMQKTQAALVL